MVTTTKKINLAQLDQELKAGGLNMDTMGSEHTISAVNPDITDAQLEAAIASHVAQFTEPSVADKLASVGLSVNDLKAALGL